LKHWFDCWNDWKRWSTSTVAVLFGNSPIEAG
jgi:hypothetical protein